MSKFSFLTRKVRTTRISRYVKFFLLHTKLDTQEFLSLKCIVFHVVIHISFSYVIYVLFVALNFKRSLVFSDVEFDNFGHIRTNIRKMKRKMFSNLIIFLGTVEFTYVLCKVSNWYYDSVNVQHTLIVQISEALYLCQFIDMFGRTLIINNKRH